MKKSSVILILIVIVIIIPVVGLVAYPASKTSTLKIKYISAIEAPWSVGNDWSGDGVGYGGIILIYIDCYINLSLSPNGIHGAFHADQYITFSGLSIGWHTIEVYRTDYSDLGAKGITSHAAILGDTTVDVHYKDGFM